MIPFVSTASPVEGGEEGLSEREEELISFSQDPRDPGIYVPYKDEYRTLKYEGWETFSNNDENITAATERVVIRRGTTLSIKGYTEADHRLYPSKENMDELEVNKVDDGWNVEIFGDATIGKYTFEITEDEWSEELDIYVIYDPEEFGIPEEELKAYAYDESGTRDEYGYIFTTGRTVYPSEDYPSNLHPFGGDFEERPSIFEFALAGAGNSSDPQESAGRLNRIVAQRNDARPKFEPLIRDASDILFYGQDSPSFLNDNYKYTHIGTIEKVEDELLEGEMPEWLRDRLDDKLEDELSEDAVISKSMGKTWIKEEDKRSYRIEEDQVEQNGETIDVLVIFDGLTQTLLDGESKKVQGMTLEDAEKLAMNGVSIHDLESGEKSKVINGWCDEASFSLVALLRSIGIPSRIVSIHPTEEVDNDLMGHFMVEAWFEESMYDTTWENESNRGDWYVLDADEWNARFPSGMEDGPDFWMPMGETFSSRKNYMRVVDLLFKGRWDTRALYAFGPEDEMRPETIDITDAYLDAGEHELEHGSVTKMIGRGGGDLYKIDIQEPTKISIESEAGAEAKIYTSEEGSPAIPTAVKGYPFDKEPSEYEGEEAILLPEDSETHYIGIYAPQNGDRTVEGNFGSYTLSVEEASEEDLKGEHQRLEDDTEMTTEHLYATVLVIIWVAAYVGKKKL
ncbi:MAG: transglutaminase domain-containing protein [Candidatus Thermoplasmatota archaeon]